MTDRQTRIATIRAAIVAESIAASASFRNISPRGAAMVRAHNAINHRSTLLRFPEVAAYWARQRLAS